MTARNARSWGGGKTDGTEEMTIAKLAYQFDGSLGLNDNRELNRKRSRCTQGHCSPCLFAPRYVELQ